MPDAKADSADDYNAGYNAGYENVAAPDSASSEDYYAGWNAGQEAATAAAQLTQPSQDQSSDSSQ